MLNVESQYAGQVLSCPACNGDLTVPEAPAARAPILKAPALGSAAAPRTNVSGPGYAQAGAPSPSSIQLFAQTKGWVTFFAVLGSISPAILLLLGLFIAFAGVSAGFAGSGMIMGLILAALGAIYFLPAWRLWQFQSAIGVLRVAPTQAALDKAIDRQRCFWKTVGIITLIGIGLSIAMVAISLSAAPDFSVEPSFGFGEFEE